jgi:lia operon protein LiaG
MRRMILAAAVLMAIPVGAQEVERVPGRSVAVYNLAGRVEVVGGSDSDVVVRITRGGADASALRVETGQIGGRSTLRIIYPDDEIVYGELGRGSTTSLNVRDDGTFSDDRNRRGSRVRIRGGGGGLEAWADLVIEVPAGNDFAVYLAAGEVEAEGVEADVLIDTGSGGVTATGMVGALDVETGSGRVIVRRVSGDLRIDTGSGRVEVSDVVGDEIEIDTGSGGVKGVGLEADVLSVDTGSGSIELEAVTSSDVVLDTGSGSIDIDLMTDIDRLDADTGSGSITVRAPPDLGAMIEIETGAGGIELDFPVEVRSVRRDHVRGTIGDGRGEIEIDTGSGSVKLVRKRN